MIIPINRVGFDGVLDGANQTGKSSPLSLLLFPLSLLFFLFSLFALTRQPSLSKDEIKSLTLRFCGCYQSPGLSSFDFRLSVPLLSVSRFYFGAERALVEFWKELVLVLYV
nr:hypothetical protein CFP56_49839 [Quercus suber]